MVRKHLKSFRLAGLGLVAPLMIGCAQSDRLVGPPVPAPLTTRQAAEIAQRQVGDRGRLEHLDDLSNGHLFAVTDVSRSGSFNESHLLFVHNNGTLAEWPGE
jgi:hypothetical protein